MSIVVRALLVAIGALLLLLTLMLCKPITTCHSHNGTIVAKHYSPAIFAIDFFTGDVPCLHYAHEEWILIIQEAGGKEVAMFVSEKFWQITQVNNEVDIPCSKGSILEPHISNELMFELHQQTKGLRVGVRGAK